MKKYVKMQFNACIENVTFARGAIASFLISEELSINTINEIKTIVSEAVTNAIVHGYKENIEMIVYFDIILDNNELTIIVKDNGVGIEDISKAKEPLFSTKLQEERAGLGFTIMDIFSDSLEIYSEINKGTTIISKKYLQE